MPLAFEQTLKKNKMYIGTNENGQISGKKNPVYVNILERETEK